MSHARIEEVSDSDPDIDDIDDYLPSDSKTIIQPSNIPGPGAPQISSEARSQEMLQPQSNNPRTQAAAQAQREAIKSYQSLYPVYFDSSRTRQDGRRVSSKLAVPNPLAREIVDAVSSIVGNSGARIAFEPDKTHPKDWSNPGRVRIQLRDSSSGKWLAGPNVKNKSHLFILVAEHLQKHPTTKEMPMRLRIQGMPVPEKIEKPAVPGGWKINEIIPLHSPAMSGGGVSDNMFKDMMAQMQAEGAAGGTGGLGGMGLPPGLMGGMPGGGGGGSGSPGGDGGGNKKKKKKGKG